MWYLQSSDVRQSVTTLVCYIQMAIKISNFFLIIILVFEPKRRWAQKEPVDGDDK